MEMTMPGKSLDPKETSPSRKSLDSQTGTRPNPGNHKDPDKDGIPSSTTGEPATEQVDRSHLVANEEYSVFTVGQKRAIIFAGSFAAWFSPMVCLMPASTPDEYH